MSKMRIVMFAVAAGSAVVAGILAKGLISKGPDVQAEIVKQVKTVSVLVAAKDIEVGERLATGAIIWKDWPADNVLEAMITKEEKPDADVAFAETRARIQMFEGEVINEKKIVDPKTGGFMSAILPKGMRAISAPAPVLGVYGSCEIGPIGGSVELLTYTGVLALLDG